MKWYAKVYRLGNDGSEEDARYEMRLHCQPPAGPVIVLWSNKPFDEALALTVDLQTVNNMTDAEAAKVIDITDLML